MIEKMFCLSIVAGCLPITAAGGLAEVCRDFGASVLAEQEAGGFGYWTASSTQPPGGCVVRFQRDVTGDGEDEFFLCSSISPERKWAVYTTKDGTLVKSGEMDLMGEASAYVRGTGDGPEVLTAIHREFSFVGVKENRFHPDGSVSTAFSSFEKPDEVESLVKKPGWPESEFGSGTVFEGAEFCSLRSLLGDAEPRWFSFDFGTRLSAQHETLSEEDAAREFPPDFTPESALDAVVQRQNDTSRTPKPSPLRDAGAPSERHGESADIEMPSADPNGGDRPTWQIGGGIAAAVGILVILIKARIRERREN